MIDLHLHTTASDGRLTPAALVARAAAAGLTTISVTDHDTVAGIDEAAEAAAAHGIRLVPGIEVTAIEDSADVHVLGYFFDPSSPPLAEFLARQRAERVRRFHDLLDRLSSLGLTVDAAALLDLMRSGEVRSIGRPHVADALVAAGYATDRTDAFDRWLGRGRPAFVPRCGDAPETVIDVIARAGGVSSLAHPGLLKMDEMIPRLAAAGLTAIEARHSAHDEAAEQHYRGLADRLGLLVTGGSDFHGDLAEGSRAPRTLGAVTLPEADWARLEARR